MNDISHTVYILKEKQLTVYDCLCLNQFITLIANFSLFIYIHVNTAILKWRLFICL